MGDHNQSSDNQNYSAIENDPEYGKSLIRRLVEDACDAQTNSDSIYYAQRKYYGAYNDFSGSWTRGGTQSNADAKNYDEQKQTTIDMENETTPKPLCFKAV